jgi:hypothetical protein
VSLKEEKKKNGVRLAFSSGKQEGGEFLKRENTPVAMRGPLKNKLKQYGKQYLQFTKTKSTKIPVDMRWLSHTARMAY